MNKLLLVLTLWLAFLVPVASAETAEPTEYRTSEAELEQMLAPVALYPDSLLTHILIAATYPLEVVQASRWAQQHSDLDIAARDKLLVEKPWDASVIALVPFTSILQKMSDDLEWTVQLGDAFLADEELLLSSIQSLRQRADEAGNLDDMEYQQVSRAENTITITTVEREVVYVPYYDTRVVYGSWHWSHYPPVYWPLAHRTHSYRPHYAYSGPFYWHSGVHLSPYFYGFSFNWHRSHIVLGHNRHHYPNSYYSNRHYSQKYPHSNRSKNFYQANKPGHPQRWQHNAQHRKGVAYRSEKLRLKHRSLRPIAPHRNVAQRSDKRPASTYQQSRKKMAVLHTPKTLTRAGSKSAQPARDNSVKRPAAKQSAKRSAKQRPARTQSIAQSIDRREKNRAAQMASRQSKALAKKSPRQSPSQLSSSVLSKGSSSALSKGAASKYANLQANLQRRKPQQLANSGRSSKAGRNNVQKNSQHKMKSKNQQRSERSNSNKGKNLASRENSKPNKNQYRSDTQSRAKKAPANSKQLAQLGSKQSKAYQQQGNRSQSKAKREYRSAQRGRAF